MLHAAGYDKAIWAGLSMGGYLVLDIQRLHPEAVAALALCDTKAAADSAQMRAKRIAIAEACESTGTHEPVMGFAASTPEDSTIKQSAAYREQFTTWINEQPAEGIAWRERMAAGRPDLNDVLPAITAPVAVICGDKDPSSPPSRDDADRRCDDRHERGYDGGIRLRAFQRIRASAGGCRRAARAGAQGAVAGIFRRCRQYRNQKYKKDNKK